MATKPNFLWGHAHAASVVAATDDSDVGIFRSSSALQTATALAAGDTAAPVLGAGAVARPRLRRDASSSSSGSGKKKQQQEVGGAAANKKPPQRGLGVAELERLRCGGDPLLELSAAVVGDAAATAAAAAHGHHPLLHYHHHHRGPAFEAAAAAAGVRYCSQLLAPVLPPAAAAPGPVCVLHHAPATAGCQLRAAPPVAPEQQYLRDRWSRMGGFSTAAGGGGADHQSPSQCQLLPPPPPELPSSQSTTIWRPAVSSSSCLHAGHRCDICSRRMRALLAENNGGALAPTPPDYSIYDLATAMATARQGDAFLPREGKQGAAEAPAKKEVREIEFFPAAGGAHRAGGGGGRFSSVPDESSELAAPFFSSPYGAAAAATGHTAPQLDLSLRL